MNEVEEAWVFPGQGAQRRGMGAELFHEFRDLVSVADGIVGYSLEELCREDPRKELSLTQYTQVALYVVGALSYQKLTQDSGRRPALVAGHSLGEYVALFASGAFDFETGLRLVQKRGELMARAGDGAMAAVVGLDEGRVRHVLHANGLHEVDIANLNAADQIVVSGTKEDISRAKSSFAPETGVKYVPLEVSGAFHSRYMQPAADEFAEFVARFSFGHLQIPVISNVEALPYSDGRIAELLVKQLTSPVRWSAIVEYMQGRVKEFVEVGPGNVLTRLIAKIRAPSKRINGSAAKATSQLRAESLGSEDFKRAYRSQFAYVAGAMSHGIASVALVERMSKAGMLSFLGADGLPLDRVARDLDALAARVRPLGSGAAAYGVGLAYNPAQPHADEALVDLLLARGIDAVEATGFVQPTPALVRYRLAAAREDKNGVVQSGHRLLAVVSRPDVAEAFLRPPPQRLVERLVGEGRLSREQARLAARLPLADDLCIDTDSTWQGEASVDVLLPAIQMLRDQLAPESRGAARARIGAGGGIGTPFSAAAAFLLGADFVMTRAVNQCSTEAAISDSAKDLLAQMGVQDTDLVPSGDLFEWGAKVRVLKKGVLFPARASKLYELFRRHESIADIDETTRHNLEERYFRRSLDDVQREMTAALGREKGHPPERAEWTPKQRLALTFRWYFQRSRRLAIEGDESQRQDYQIQSSPALGAFNQFAQGGPLASWRERHVDRIAETILHGAADFSSRRIQSWLARTQLHEEKAK